MSKVPSLSYAEVIRALLRDSWSGSEAATMRHSCSNFNLIPHVIAHLQQGERLIEGYGDLSGLG